MAEQRLISRADIKNPMVLFTAIKNGSLTTVEHLLKNGADPNVIYSYPGLLEWMTHLHAAVYWKQVEVAELLIKYGAIVNIKGGRKTTPIVDAIQNEDTEMIKLFLINGADMKDPDVLYTAVENGNLKIVEDLLKDGADPNMINDSDSFDGLTPLHVAVEWKQVEIAKLLINHGAKVNVKMYGDTSLIVHAIIVQNIEMIEVLLTNGITNDIRDDPTVLCAAAFHGYLTLVEDLLKKGADPNMVDIGGLFNGDTPLRCAEITHQMEMVKLLLNYGANVNTTDGPCGPSLVTNTIARDETEMMKLFLINGANIREDASDYKLHSKPRTPKLLKQHIAKLKAAGLHVSEKNLLWISNDCEINKFLNECEAEIQIMKSQKIDNSCASFYDILTKNTSELAKNESIVQAFKSNSYKTKFPIYASMIDCRFRRGLEREELLEQVRKKFLQSLFESLPDLPLPCFENIISYLSDRDLRILLYA